MAIFPFKREPPSAKAAEDREKDDEKGFLEAAKETEKIEGKTEEVLPGTLPAEIRREEEKKKEAERKPGERREQPSAAPPPTQPASITAEVVVPIKIEKSDTLREIEQILSENLDELYTSLSIEQKNIFKKRGEETASKLELLVKEVKINFKKILILIKEWLLILAQMIPGINKIFLVQEAKIKADKILFLAERNAKIVKNLK